MSDVTVDLKDDAVLDEIMIMDLTVPYAILWHSGSKNATRIDMHLKMDEAKALYNALKEQLENQVVSPSVDR